jgi:hypothetical protein
VGVDGGEEPVHRLGAAVFGTAGAHQHPRVVGRQGGERIEVPLGEGMDEAADQCALIWPAGWRWQTGGRAGASVVQRARQSALVTVSSVFPSNSAVSLARHPSTSRSTRWPNGMAARTGRTTLRRRGRTSPRPQRAVDDSLE